MRINFPVLTVCLFASYSAPAFGQNSTEDSCDVPLVVTRFVPSSRTVELVTDLGPDDLAVQVGAIPTKLDRASIDDGPKRIALVLDASGNVPADEWTLQTKMAVKLAQHARREDRFALLVVGIDSPVSSLLSSGDVVRELKKMSSSRPVSGQSGERTYDALFAAANRLNPSKFGDAIFLFGHPGDSGSKENSNAVMELVLKNRLRFYAVSFSNPLRGKLPPGFDLNKPLPTNLAPPELANMSAATGYFFSFHSIKDLDIPGQTKLFEDFLTTLYTGIARPYRLKMPVSEGQGEVTLQIIVTKREERKINDRDVHYPHSIYPCHSSASSIPLT